MTVVGYPDEESWMVAEFIAEFGYYPPSCRRSGPVDPETGMQSLPPMPDLLDCESDYVSSEVVMERGLRYRQLGDARELEDGLWEGSCDAWWEEREDRRIREEVQAEFDRRVGKSWVYVESEEQRKTKDEYSQFLREVGRPEGNGRARGRDRRRESGRGRGKREAERLSGRRQRQRAGSAGESRAASGGSGAHGRGAGSQGSRQTRSQTGRCASAPAPASGLPGDLS